MKLSTRRNPPEFISNAIELTRRVKAVFPEATFYGIPDFNNPDDDLHILLAGIDLTQLKSVELSDLKHVWIDSDEILCPGVYLSVIKDLELADVPNGEVIDIE